MDASFQPNKRLSPDPTFNSLPVRIEVPPHTNPFRGLDILTAGPPSGVVRDILVQTKEQQLASVGSMLIVPEIADLPPMGDTIEDVLRETRIDRGHPDLTYLATTQSGAALFEITPPTYPGFGLLSIGGLSSNDRNILRQSYAAHTEVACSDTLVALIDFEPGKLYLEVGAGAHSERLLALNAAALRSGTNFLCHDVAPSHVRWAVDGAPGVPYMALPPYEDILTAALASTSPGGVMSTRNTVSSFRHEDLGQWLSVADTLGFDRILVTQSVGISKQHNYWQEHYSPRHSIFTTACQRDIMAWTVSGNAAGVNRRFGAEATPLVSAALGGATQDSAYGLGLAIVYMHMIERARHCTPFQHTRCVIERRERTLPNESAQSYLAGAFPKTCLTTDYEKGLFNVIQISCSGAKSFDRRSEVPSGSLLVQGEELHLEFSRTADFRPLPYTPSHVSLRPGGYADFVLPPGKPALTSLDLLERFHVLQGPILTPALERLAGTKTDLRELYLVALEIGWKWNRLALGERLSSPVIAPIRHCIDEIYRATRERVLNGS